MNQQPKDRSPSLSSSRCGPSRKSFQPNQSLPPVSSSAKRHERTQRPTPDPYAACGGYDGEALSRAPITVLTVFPTVSIHGGLLLQLPSVGAKNIFFSGGTTNPGVSFPSIACHNRRCSRIRPSVFSAGDGRPQLDENPEGIISGEWTENFSLLSYDDLRAYLESHVTAHKVGPCSPLREVMSTAIVTATASQMLDEIDHHFEAVSGLPVVDGERRCIGVVCRSDGSRASSLGSKTSVGEVMSSPAITLSPEKTVTDAAALMLKMKIHRIPILNEERRVIGIVTRTDILEALEA